MTTYKNEDSTVIPETVAPDGQVRVIRANNPFDFKDHVITFHSLEDGDLYKDLISAEIAEIPDEILTTSLNGEVITREEWETRKLTSGDSVVIFEMPGGDSAKDILRLIALVAIVFFAPYLGGTVLGLEGTALVAFEVAFVVAGSLLVNAILPPAMPDGISIDSMADSPTYGIDGAKNTSEEGLPLPVCYGGFRMAGNILNVHTRNAGGNQLLYMLFNAGEGQIQGITDVELNDQPIEGFLEAETEVRLGLEEGDPIPWFEESVSPTSVGVTLNTTHQTRTTGVIDRFRLDFVCPNGLVEFKDNGDKARRTIQFDIQYKLTTEPTVWTTLYNYRAPEPGDPFYRYFGYNNYDGAGQITGTALIEIRGDLRDLNHGVNTEGWIVDEFGRIVGQQSGSVIYTTLPDISRRQTTPVRFSFYSPNDLPQGAYDIRVRRTLPESTDTQVRDSVAWTDLNEIITDPVAYNHCALLGLKIKLTDQLGSLPNVTYYNGGRVIRHWDSVQKEWVDIASKNPAWIAWDMLTNLRYGGQIDPARLDQDAWLEWGEYCDAEGLTFQGVFDTNAKMWDAMQHVFRAGHARPIRMGTQYSVAVDKVTAPSQMFTVGNILKDSFSQKWMSLADRANEIEVNYFDQNDKYKRRTIKVYDDAIATGAPQNTSNVTLFGIVDETRAAEEGTFMLNSNRLMKSTVSFKAPMEAVAVTIGDVFLLQHDQPDWSVGGRLEFNSTTTNLKSDREVTFDGAKSYSALVRYDSITRYTAQITGISAGGRRLELGVPFTGQTDIDRVQKTGIDRRITRIESDAIWVKDGTGFAVLDNVDLIQVDAIETATVTALTSGTLTDIPLSTALPSNPPQHSVFMVGETALVSSLWRATKVAVDKDMNATITGAEYNAAIYDWTPQNVQPVNATDFDLSVPHVTNLAADESTALIGNVLRPVLELSWDLPPDFESYGGVDVEISIDGEGFKFAKRYFGAELGTEVEVSRGTIDVRVVTMSADGRFALRSTAPTVLGLIISGDDIAPNVPTGFAVTAGAVGLNLSWTNPVDADFNSIDIKRNTVDNEGTAVALAYTSTKQVSYLDDTASNDAVSYFYWARAVDENGNTSAWVPSTPVSATPTSITSGTDATSGYLTNEVHAIPSDADGSNPVFSGASGYFKVFKGINDITATSTFSVFGADGATVTINTAVDTPVSGQPAGYYEVTGETVALASHAVTLRAVTVDALTIDKVFTVTKAAGGVDAKLVSLTATGLNFSYDNTTGTPALIGPASISLVVNEQNTTGATGWSAWDHTGTPITPVSTLLSSITDAGATILETAFNGIANNDFITVSAIREGITDTISVVRLLSGQDGADGATGDIGPDGPAGFNTATVNLFHKNTSSVTPPATFTGTFTYTFATAALSGGVLNGWSQTAPDIVPGEYLWVRQATAVSNTATDDIVSTEFAGGAVVGIGGEDGATGEQVTQVSQVIQEQPVQMV